MQLYYVKTPCTLTLPHKTAKLIPPSAHALQMLRIPYESIYCGNVGWEVIQARAQLGSDAVVVQEFTPEIHALLPPRIRAWSDGGDLLAQVQKLAGNRLVEMRPSPLRIALINGVGTMLGDTLVGSRALEIAIERISAAFGTVEIHVVLAWNARPGAEGILRRSPVVTSLQENAITLELLRGFDAYWDFSVLLRLEGYNTQPLIDFYLEHFAIDPQSIAAEDKLPKLRLSSAHRAESKRVVDSFRKGRKLVLIQGAASTPLRSMPDSFLLLLLADILSQTDACIVLTQPLPPQGLPIHDSDRVVQLVPWCALKTENYLSLFGEIDALVSVDTLAIHAAMAERKQGVAIFTTIDPAFRLSCTSQLQGILIPGAKDLPLWGKHKEDANWELHQPAYNAAWLSLDRTVILLSVRSALAQSTPTITVDNKEYALGALSDEAKAQLAGLQFVDSELEHLNAQTAVLQTARFAYAKALRDALGNATSTRIPDG